jgi:hypothetical protein
MVHDILVTPFMQIDTAKNIYIKNDKITIKRKKNKGTSTLAPPFVGGFGQRQRSIVHGIIDYILGFD